MYLRTPKRYQKQRRHVVSLRWLWLWILTPVVAFAGYLIYENRHEFAPPVQAFISEIASSAGDGMATITAPTPQPTENPVGRLQIANAAWAQGSIDQALMEFEQALPNDPNNYRAHYLYTFGLVMQGRAREALEAAEKTVTANPYWADAWAVRALALNENGRQGEAIASAMQALSLDSNSARATAFLAQAYFDSNQIERALTTVNRALTMDPDSFEALYVYGLIQSRSVFDFQAAMESFQRAYDIAPNMPYIGVEIASIQLRNEDAQGAFDTIENILDASPRNADALFNAAYITYSAFGDPNQAMDYLSRCVESAPDNVLCHNYMGTVYYFGMSDLTKAAQHFVRAIEAGSRTPRHFLSAGRVLTQINNCRDAIPILREGREIEASRRVSNSDLLTQFDEALAGCGSNAPAQPTIAPVESDLALEVQSDVEGDAT